ncbi:MAG: M48 family metallopeptidase [Alphaproteobacteria bacterium]|mgnify:CR=1 FL=1|jgi:heat shock protein HtpX|nr:M48 family metallopeptidase [Alphaproteobacteria bacterium]
MGEAYGLYSHIRANRFRSGVLIVGLLILVYLLVFAFVLAFNGFMIGDEPLDYILSASVEQFVYLLPWATLATGIWTFIGFSFHQRMIDASTGAKDVTRDEEPRLYNLLENLCISRGIAMPKLQIIETDVLNAYASGMSEKQYKVAVTRGLVNTLDDAELEAVLAHELTHIRNGDVRLMVVAVIIAGVVTFAGELAFRGFFRGGTSGTRWSSGSSSGGGKKGGGGAIAIVIALVIIAVAWFLSLVIRFALSRSREYLADAGAVELTKNPDAMIGALRKIEGKSEMPSVPSGIMEMCIENQKNSIADLFSTHPSVQRRVEKLVAVAGGRDRVAETTSPSA